PRLRAGNAVLPRYLTGRYRSGQTGRTVNPLANAFSGSNPLLPRLAVKLINTCSAVDCPLRLENSRSCTETHEKPPKCMYFWQRMAASFDPCRRCPYPSGESKAHIRSHHQPAESFASSFALLTILVARCHAAIFVGFPASFLTFVMRRP